jgi:hypothetical protein
MKALIVCVLTAFAAQGSALPSAAGYRIPQSQPKDQSKDQGKQTAASKAEQDAAAKVQMAADVPAKVAAAGEFVKKYPKSSQRTQVLTYVSREVEKMQDAAQRIAQLESLLTVFKEPSDGAVIKPILIDAYFNAERPDDGFRVATAYVSENPNEIAARIQIIRQGVEQAKKRNAKYIQISQESGLKAVELIEAGKKPAMLDDAGWSEYQTKWLPTLYQWLGMISMMTGNKADAKAKVDKAMSLNADDPFTFALAGSLVEDEYQQIANEYKSASPGPARDAILQQAYMKMDDVIDKYAHAVGLSEGKAAYQQLHDQLLPDLQRYYAYRHGGKSDGIQQLIDKYKKQ